jgi:hypothetical protein
MSNNVCAMVYVRMIYQLQKLYDVKWETISMQDLMY